MRSLSILRYLLITCITVSLTACQQAQDPPQSTAGSSPVHSAQAAATQESSHRLVGQWEGKLDLDPQAIEQVFKEAGREAELDAALETYRNMQMQMAFDRDGVMKISVKIGADETGETNSASGTWELVRDEGNTSIVRSQETGSEEEEIEISFNDDDHFQTLPKGPLRNAAVLKFSRIR